MMICPNCLEELRFVKFDVDPNTIEHRGVFACACCDDFVLPEFMTREALSDEDLKDRLRISRLFYLGKTVHDQSREAAANDQEVIRLHTRRLERYLEHFAEQSLRQLK